MNIRSWLWELWQDVKAFRRGEKRVLPHGSRGRVYERRDGRRAGTTQVAKGLPKGTISARVYRAATGEWEDHGVISKPKE